MPSGIYSIVERLLRDTKFDINTDAFLAYCRYLKKGSWIHPSTVQRNIKSDIKGIYCVLNYLVEKGVLEEFIEVYCPECCKYTNYYFRTLMEIPPEVFCPHCDNEIESPTGFAVLVYKVIADDE